MGSIPDCVLRWSSQRMPVLGLGTASDRVEELGLVTKQAVLEAIKLGYRHFDTASLYGSEPALGEAITEAVSLGLIKSRDELFITSKLWCTDGYGDLVLPALRTTLQNLKLDYLDLYLIHWPISLKKRSEGVSASGDKEYVFIPMDLSSVWSAMEDCQRLGFTKSIGLSNFTRKKVADILSIAKVPPVVNQVELNPLWQQKKLKEFCHGNGVLLSAFSPLGAAGTSWGSNRVMEYEPLKEIAKVKGKTVAQVCLRWAYEQGVSIIVKSFNAERMKQNLGIFDWSLSEDEVKMMDQIPQSRGCRAELFVSEDGPFKTLEELWDGEI